MFDRTGTSKCTVDACCTAGLPPEYRQTNLRLDATLCSGRISITSTRSVNSVILILVSHPDLNTGQVPREYMSKLAVDR